LKYLDCRDNQLTNLDLRKNIKLTQLDCSYNQLAFLELANNLQLEELYCSNNLFNDVDSLLSRLNPEKLKKLDLSNNKFSLQHLTTFAKIINLEELDISNNLFVGSLKPLQNLTKLKSLHIENTNVDSNLECLPSSLEKFQCYDPDYEKDSCKSTELYQKELRGFNGDLRT
jgi:Leucine-rich repeat (LRR) protein